MITRDICTLQEFYLGKKRSYEFICYTVSKTVVLFHNDITREIGKDHCRLFRLIVFKRTEDEAPGKKIENPFFFFTITLKRTLSLWDMHHCYVCLHCPIQF